MISEVSKCPICHSKKEILTEKYCKIHTKAKAKLKQGYEAWLKAYGILSWNDYLQKLLDKNLATGKLIKDIIEYELYFS